jgi:predicted metal-dependent phosphoesterase TrpH
MSGYADLHVHTNASDGAWAPSKVVERAVSLGFSAIAITDHDAVSGIDEAVETGRRDGIEVIPGVELSTEYEDKEVHILGYFFDYHDETLNRLIQEFRDFRVKRMEQMLVILRKLGCRLDEEKLMKNSEEGAIGRVHLAKAMMASGFVTSIDEAFNQYLAVGRPAYMKKAKLTPAQACSLIKQTKGVPILAHPFLMKKDEWIPDFVHAGVEGLEAYYPGMALQDIEYYTKMSEKMGILITGGSDCHQSGTKSLMGLIKLPYEHVELLKKFADKRRGKKRK